jgi:hypothetical protein
MKALGIMRLVARCAATADERVPRGLPEGLGAAAIMTGDAW